MNEKQDSWRPSPAKSPPSLKTKTTTASSTTFVPPSAALRGAASAFLPKPNLSSIGLNSTSNGAKLAAAAAGSHTQRGRLNVTVYDGNGSSTKRSPSRGRHLQPQSAQIAGARSATSASRPVPSQVPAFTRTSSAIAARLASASSSPVRSGVSPSPHRLPHTRIELDRQVTKQSCSSNETNALSGAITPMSSSPSKHDLPNVRSRILNFEHIPSLQPHKSSTPQDVENQTSGMRAARHAFTTMPTISTSTVRHVASAATTTSALTSALMEATNEKSSSQDSWSTYQNPPYAKGILDKPPPAGPRREVVAQQPISPPGRVGTTVLHDDKTAIAISNLADAMVASSLASRASSPSKEPYSSMSRRRSASVSDLRDRASMYDNNKLQVPVPVRPPRPMKHTLRKHSSENDEDAELAKRGRRHLVRKHPNMHHEGDRKRWRDKITNFERKRYEGVFAANRGLLLGPGSFQASPSMLVDPLSETNQVANLIVRDIWERSRLPRDVLMDVYELVAPDAPQTLNREQFVVGLWLIDQRLKGRKLPVEVSMSVWDSVRHSQGIKIRSRAG